MKRLTPMLLAVPALGFSPAINATPAEGGCDLNVTVANVKEPKGFIFAALYTEATWNGGAPAKVARVAATETAVDLCLPVEQGRYAIRLFHDLDGNGKLASSMVGLPQEPYGFSNDAPIQFGPPAFAAAAFQKAAAPMALTITLR